MKTNGTSQTKNKYSHICCNQYEDWKKKKITCKATAIFSCMDGSFLIRVIKSLAKGPKFWQVSVG